MRHSFLIFYSLIFFATTEIAFGQQLYDVSEAIYMGDVKSFSILDQGTGANCVRFDTTGTKMFVLNSSRLAFDNILEYDLSTPFDPATASYAGDAEKLSVTSYGGVPESFLFNNDGTKLYLLVGTFEDELIEFALATPYDISTATHLGNDQHLILWTEEHLPTSFAFNNDGTKLFVIGFDNEMVNEYDLDTAYDVSSAEYAGDEERFPLTDQDRGPKDIAFNDNGTKMYILGVSGNDVNEYDLSVAFDVSTASYAGESETVSVEDQENRVQSMAFNADGSRMYILGLGADAVVQYTLTGENVHPVITSINPVLNINDKDEAKVFEDLIIQDGNNDELSAEITLLNGSGIFSGDGLTGSGPYLTDTLVVSGLQDVLNAITFDPADDVAVNGAADTLLVRIEIADDSLSVVDTIQTIVESGALVTLLKTGTFGPDTSAVEFEIKFNEPVFELDTSDLNIEASEKVSFRLASLTGSDSVYTLLFDSLGGDGVIEVSIREGNDIKDSLNNPLTQSAYDGHIVGRSFNLSFAAYTGDDKTLSVKPPARQSQRLRFSPDGMKMYVLGASSTLTAIEDLFEFQLSSAFDLATATYSDSWKIPGSDYYRSFIISPDGLKLFALASIDDEVKQFTLSTPFLISSATYDGDDEVLTLGTELGSPQDIAFSNDGLSVYILDGDDDKIEQYELKVAYDVSTGAYMGSQNSINVSSDSPSTPQSIEFSNDGRKLFVHELKLFDIDEKIHTYSMSTPFDITSAVYLGDDEIIDVSDQERNLSGFTFSNDGNHLFILGEEGDDVSEYIICNTAPEITQISDASVQVGSQLLISFEISDLHDDDITIGADSTSSNKGMITNNSLQTLSWTPDTSDVGQHEVIVTVDDGELSTTDTFQINVVLLPYVNSAISDQTTLEGVAYEFTFSESTFVDPLGSELNYIAIKQDSTALPAWLSFDDNTRTFSGTPTSSDIGMIGIQVYAYNDRGDSISDAFELDVDFLANIWNGTSWSVGQKPTSSDSAVIAGNYYSSVEGTFTSRALTVMSGDTLFLDAPGTHVLIEDTLSNSGTIEVSSGAGLVTRGGVSDGEYYFERITTFSKEQAKYSMIGSPIESGNTNELGTVVYKYDETVAYDTTSGVEGLNRFVLLPEAGESMTPGQGYFSAYTGTVMMKGKPNHGDISYDLSRTNHSFLEADSSENDFEGFHVVANPYPAAISLQKFINGNAGNIVETVWIWDDGGSNVGRRGNSDYLTINVLGVSMGGSSRGGAWNSHIGSFQGFFVKADHTTSLGFADSMKVVGNNRSEAFFRTKSAYQTLKLSLSKEGEHQYETLVGFTSDATAKVDDVYDAPLLNSGLKNQVFSSIDQVAYAIQAVGLDKPLVSVGVSLEKDGLYMLSLSNLNIDRSQTVYLTDHFTGEKVVLNDIGYEFLGTEGVYKERFTLQIGDKSALTDVQSLHSALQVFSADQTLFIRSEVLTHLESIKIFSLTGELVEELEQIDLPKHGYERQVGLTGIYIVAVVSDDMVRIQKVRF